MERGSVVSLYSLTSSCRVRLKCAQTFYSTGSAQQFLTIGVVVAFDPASHWIIILPQLAATSTGDK